ncbi:hypothetical protein PanWU01x14_348550 [Parasponia andersonii]|uniref:Uncharacterized protein n=1 Tax=Parasponia andersonii TaxID=3476 RepID=A0A2P5ABN1_PARAD|nr:hypothetical protein PanWU01x14_348550 [Parasponia andersonii]
MTGFASIQASQTHLLTTTRSSSALNTSSLFVFLVISVRVKFVGHRCFFFCQNSFISQGLLEQKRKEKDKDSLRMKKKEMGQEEPMEEEKRMMMGKLILMGCLTTAYGGVLAL